MSLFNRFGKSANSLAFRQKKLDRAVKTAFCLSIGPFWGKRFLWENFVRFITFGGRANFFQRFVDYFFKGFSTLHFMFPSERFEEKLSVFEKNVSFFIIFGYWVNNFWSSAIKKSLDLSKLASTCPKVQFEAKKKLFLKDVQFSKHARTLNNKTSFYCWKKFGGVVKAPLYVSVGT